MNVTGSARTPDREVGQLSIRRGPAHDEALLAQLSAECARRWPSTAHDVSQRARRTQLLAPITPARGQFNGRRDPIPSIGLKQPSIVTRGAAVHQPLGGGVVVGLVALVIVQSCVCATLVIGSTSLVDVTATDWPDAIKDSCAAVSVIVWVWLPSFDDV